MFGISASLVENAWNDLTRRGMTVTTTREPGWKWFPEEKYRTQVILSTRVQAASSDATILEESTRCSSP